MVACEKDWLDILQGFLVPIIAFLGVYIGWQQWSTNRRRLDHELFDRRFSLYEEVLRLFGNVLRKGNTKAVDILEFIEATKSAKFVFDTEVSDFLDQAVLRFSDLETIEAEFEDMEKGEQRSALVTKRREVRNWFHDELLSLDIRFEKHMSLTHEPVLQRIKKHLKKSCKKRAIHESKQV